VVQNNYGDAVVQLNGQSSDLATTLRAVEEEPQRQILTVTRRTADALRVPVTAPGH
jgi:hypothetical protein